MAVKTIGAAQFKERCLALLDTVGPDGIVITEHGKPVAKLVPVTSESRDLLGPWRGKLRIAGTCSPPAWGEMLNLDTHIRSTRSTGG